ncbi:hypothetical protein TsFJ059_005158, partial [Trichoderma semiorbis]
YVVVPRGEQRLIDITKNIPVLRIHPDWPWPDNDCNDVYDICGYTYLNKQKQHRDIRFTRPGT